MRSILEIKPFQKIFTITSAALGGGSVVQEATRHFGSPFTFRHIAESTLPDVKITIYDSNDNPILANQPMIEIGGSGVYKYVYNPPTPSPLAQKIYTGIMGSNSFGSKSVTEIIFVPAEYDDEGGTTKTVISNRVGVGKRGKCK